MKKYRIAFAGFRHNHIQSLYYHAEMMGDRVEIAGAFEEDDKTRKELEASGNINFKYNTYKELLNDKTIDIVAIGDYFAIRGKRAIDALNAGKHIIVDKPLCTDLEELSKIEKIAKEKGLEVRSMLDMRFSSFVNCAREVVESGRIGEVNNIVLTGQHPLMYGQRPKWYYEDGKHGGVINDIGIHGIDIIKTITGLSVKRVLAAREWNAFATEDKNFLDSAQFMLELQNGAGVLCDVSYAAPEKIGFKLPSYWNVGIWGTNGMINCGANLKTLDLYISGADEVEKIDIVRADYNHVGDLIKYLDNEGGNVLTNKIVIDSARETLKIQKFADEYNKSLN